MIFFGTPLPSYSWFGAIVKSVRCYFGTPLPLRGGFPPKIHSHPAVHTQRMGVFLPVLRTPFNVRLYAAFMRAYAAYRRPQNIEFYSIRQKNTHLLAYVQFLLYLCARILKLTIRQTGRKMNGHLGKKKRENEKRAEIYQDARLRE